MGRRPAPDTPALIDVRVLLVAALLVAPAAWQASQGLLSVDQVLTRYLFVALGCTVVLAFVRTVWPVLAGELSAAGPGDEAEIGSAADDGGQADPIGPEVSRPPG